MAELKISGVWKAPDGEITHYAIHTVHTTGVSRGMKTPKSVAVRLLNQTTNEAVIWLWDYQKALWKDGERITVINNSYLRSNPDNKLTDNLAHLINYDWV